MNVVPSRTVTARSGLPAASKASAVTRTPSRSGGLGLESNSTQEGSWEPVDSPEKSRFRRLTSSARLGRAQYRRR